MIHLAARGSQGGGGVPDSSRPDLREAGVVVPARLGPERAATPVTLLIAPAGFGKTTVVRSWLAEVQDPVAVVAFDEFSRAGSAVDVGVSLLKGLEALSGREVRASLEPLLRTDGSSLGAGFLSALRQELNAIPGRFLLVIEDLHRVDSEAAAQLGSLIRQTASDAHRFVISSRTENSWPVLKWAMDGFATVLTAEDLRLRDAEVERILTPRFTPFVEQVIEFSDGWPAAVQIARWRLATDREAPLEGAFVDATDFILAEIVPFLPDDDARILSRLSILDPFPLSVAAVVTGYPGTARVLQETMKRTALVSTTDGGRFVIHRTLREAFRQVLISSEPEQASELHRRAADGWLRLPRTIEVLISAMEHYLRGEAWTSAADLLHEAWSVMESQSRLDLVARWLDEMPEQYWLDDPDLLALAVSANLRLGRTVRAGRLMRLAPHHGGELAVVRVGLASASTVGWNADPILAERFCEQHHDELVALDADPNHHNGLVLPGVTRYELAAALSLAQAKALQGRLSEAVEAYRAILARPSDVAMSVMISVHGGLAWSLALIGDVRESLRNSEAALSLAVELGRRTHVRTIPALLAKALASFLTGEPETTKLLLEEVVRLGRAGGAQNLLYVADMVGVICGIGLVSGDRLVPGARAAVLPLAAQFIGARNLRDDALRGRLTAARIGMTKTLPHELALCEWVEALITLDGRGAAAQWLAGFPKPSGPLATIVRLLADAAVTGDAAEAVRLAERAADLADSLDMPGSLAVAPSPLWQRREVAKSAHPLLVEAVRRSVAESTRSGGLTGRELELLRLMTTDLTIFELAERLFVSVPTLKWHRANLYRKLGASSRREALDRASDLGLLAANEGATHTSRRPHRGAS